MNQFVEHFSKRLINARKVAGLSLQELSDNTAISKQALSNYELGLSSPNSSALINMAKCLNVDPAYFFLHGTSTISLDKIKFREEKKHNDFELNKLKLKSLQKVEDYLYLERLSGTNNNFNNPLESLPKIEKKVDVIKAAKLLRKKWQLGNEPILKVTDLLEKHGIRILEFSCSLKFEGLSSMVGNIPLIVINNNIEETTRRRFTLMHELCHLLLKFLSKKNEEKFCNQFAAAMLLPPEVIKNEFKNRTHINMKELNRIKQKYGISVQAILFSAADYNIISLDKAFEWRDSQIANYNTESYPINEISTRYEDLVWKCYNEDRISKNKAADYLNINLQELESMPNFRLL